VSELTFASTQELVDELLRRNTFLGVVIQSEKEYRGENWGEERVFRVHFNSNLDGEETGRLLDAVAERMIADKW